MRIIVKYIYKTLGNIVNIFVTFKSIVNDYLINFKFDNILIQYNILNLKTSKLFWTQIWYGFKKFGYNTLK